MSETKQRTPYPLRMPDEMRDTLKNAAKENDRSLNAEIVARLEISIRGAEAMDKYEHATETAKRLLDETHAAIEESKRVRNETEKYAIEAAELVRQIREERAAAKNKGEEEG